MKKFSTFIVENATDMALDVVARSFNLGTVKDRPEDHRPHAEHEEEEEEHEEHHKAETSQETAPNHTTPKTHVEPRAETTIKKQEPAPKAKAFKPTDIDRAHKAVNSTIYRGGNRSQ